MTISIMRLRLFIVLLTTAMCSTAVAAQEMRRATAAHTEDPAILEKVKQWQDGWKARDAELFAKPFATDADYVIVNGRHLKGRKAIEEGHRGLFGRIPKEDPKESESVRDEVTIRYLRPDVALVHTVGFGTVHNIATLVLIKGAQGWRSQHFNGLQLKRNPQGDQIGNQVPLVAKYSPAA